MPRRNTQVRLDALLCYIQANRPTRLEILNELYDLSTAGIRRFQQDLKYLREEYEIIVGEDERYDLQDRATTIAIFKRVLTEEERQLLARLPQEFQPGHPYLVEVRMLLAKLGGRLGQQQAQLENYAPIAYFGPRFARDYGQHRPTIKKLEEAIQQMRCIKFVNVQPVSREKEGVPHFEIEPQFLEVRNGTLYLYGYSTYKQWCYYYRIDKIQNLEILPQKFAAFRNPQAYMLQFEYLLHPALVKGGISERFPIQEVLEILPDGWAHVRAWGTDGFWIRQEMLRLGKMAKLVSPPELVAQFTVELKQMLAYYEK